MNLITQAHVHQSTPITRHKNKPMQVTDNNTQPQQAANNDIISFDVDKTNPYVIQFVNTSVSNNLVGYTIVPSTNFSPRFLRFVLDNEITLDKKAKIRMSSPASTFINKKTGTVTITFYPKINMKPTGKTDSEI